VAPLPPVPKSAKKDNRCDLLLVTAKRRLVHGLFSRCCTGPPPKKPARFADSVRHVVANLQPSGVSLSLFFPGCFFCSVIVRFFRFASFYTPPPNPWRLFVELVYLCGRSKTPPGSETRRFLDVEIRIFTPPRSVVRFLPPSPFSPVKYGFDDTATPPPLFLCTLERPVLVA